MLLPHLYRFALVRLIQKFIATAAFDVIEDTFTLSMTLTLTYHVAVYITVPLG